MAAPHTHLALFRRGFNMFSWWIARRGLFRQVN
jgi:hypothetical protein